MRMNEPRLRPHSHHHIKWKIQYYDGIKGLCLTFYFYFQMYIISASAQQHSDLPARTRE